MGNFIGNILALVAIIVVASLGFISLKTSVLTFLIIAYVFWFILWHHAWILGRTITSQFRGMLTNNEFRAFKKYNVHLRATGVGHLISSFLNLLRLAGIVWSVVAVWNELYVEGSAAIAYFFVSSGLILRSDPIRYMGIQAQSGNEVARAELGLIQSVTKKREQYLGDNLSQGSEDDGIDGEKITDEVLYYRAVSDYVTKLGYYEELLIAEGTDEEFCIASMKFYKASFGADMSEKVVAALTIEALTIYRTDKPRAITFLQVLVKQNMKKASNEGLELGGADFEPTEYDDYHEALDAMVDRLKVPMLTICNDEENSLVEIKCELLCYAVAYQAKLLIGAKIPLISWNSFKSSIEYRIFPLLDKIPKLSGSRVLPDGGVEFIQYASEYTSYMSELEKIIDQNTNPEVVDIIPLLQYFVVAKDSISSDKLAHLRKQLKWSIDLCSRFIVPEVQSVFS